MLPAVAAGAEGHLGVGRDPQAAHLDVVVRNVPHREEGVAAGIDGGIAPVLGPGVDAQQSHGTLGGFCTVGLHGRSMVGLFKIIGGGRGGGSLGQRGGAAGHAQGQCQAEGKGAEQLFHGVTSKEKKIQVKDRRFLGCCQEKDICRLYPRGRLC